MSNPLFTNNSLDELLNLISGVVTSGPKLEFGEATVYAEYVKAVDQFRFDVSGLQAPNSKLPKGFPTSISNLTYSEVVTLRDHLNKLLDERDATLNA